MALTMATSTTRCATGSATPGWASRPVLVEPWGRGIRISERTHRGSCGRNGIRAARVERHRTGRAVATPQALLYQYWSVTALTTVGHGDISASTEQETVDCGIGMVVGVLFYGHIVASLTVILASIYANGPALGAGKLRKFPRLLLKKVFYYLGPCGARAACRVYAVPPVCFAASCLLGAASNRCGALARS